MVKRILIGLAVCLALWGGNARAQTSCNQPLFAESNTSIAPDLVVPAGNGSNYYLCNATIVWHSAANRWLMLFNGTSLPSNGATTQCGTGKPAANCLMYCAPISTSGGSADGFQTFSWVNSPLAFNTGLVAAVSVSSSGCASLTADGNNDWFYLQVLTP